MTAIQLVKTEMYYEYLTGIAIEIPEGYVGLMFPRSSISKTKQILSNHVGVIDSGFRGEIRFRFKKLAWDNGDLYDVGDKIGQLVIMPIPAIELVEVDELSDSERGEGGFGSTGN
jgi:dUTP pyrophosphatase